MHKCFECPLFNYRSKRKHQHHMTLNVDDFQKATPANGLRVEFGNFNDATNSGEFLLDTIDLESPSPVKDDNAGVIEAVTLLDHATEEFGSREITTFKRISENDKENGEVKTEKGNAPSTFTEDSKPGNHGDDEDISDKKDSEDDENESEDDEKNIVNAEKTNDQIATNAEEKPDTVTTNTDKENLEKPATVENDNTPKDNTQSNSESDSGKPNDLDPQKENTEKEEESKVSDL